MRQFGSLGQFANHLLTLQVSEVLALHAGLESVAKLVQTTARAEIGEYQPAAGPFGAWEPLADSTEAEKARLGYPADAPLLRTGALRDSIGHEVGGLEAVIGSTSDVMVYQEMGTPSIPPRPVLGPAVVRNKERIEAILGAAAVSGLIGGERMDAALGYDFGTK